MTLPNKQLRVSHSPLSDRIYAGFSDKSGRFFRAGKQDVTSDVLRAIVDHVTPGHKVDVLVDGKPKYRITVIEIEPQ